MKTIPNPIPNVFLVLLKKVDINSEIQNKGYAENNVVILSNRY